MSTGYTVGIEKGISFETFAIQCARAFGALITMRDDPMDALIPDEIKPDKYHYNELKKAEKELILAKKITIKEAKKFAQDEYEKGLKYNTETITKKKNLKEKYENMLQHVQNWHPPTSEHLNFKKFMIDQITDSINFDCNIKYNENPVIKMTAREYLKQHIENRENDVKYHSEHYQKEIKSCEGRTNWIQELKKSLKI
jgi:hypothetical protein